MFSVLKPFKEAELLCSMLPLPTEGQHASRKAVYTYADKTCIDQVGRYQGAIG